MIDRARSAIFPPGKSDDQVREENTQQFAGSETNAELAAMTQLGLPTRVVVGGLVPDSAAAGALRGGGAAGPDPRRGAGGPAAAGGRRTRG